MPEGKHIVKSFNLDHTKVKAPFIRLADKIVGPKGDLITKLDLRFTQPNKACMDMPSVHTLEHLLATYLREGKKYNIIDLSPMGCQTGFYLAMFGEVSLAEFREYFMWALGRILDSTEIPGATEVECGNYKSHSLEGAKKFAKALLDAEIGLIE